MAQVTVENAAEILNEYLKSHGIMQSYVAERMGVTPQTFNNYLKGRNKFDADFALSVAKALDIPADIFLKKDYRKTVE